MIDAKKIKEHLKWRALLSDDLDTQTAALLIDFDGNFMEYGVNRIPQGIIKTLDRQGRPAKYTWIEHAERDLIAKCARNGLPTYQLRMALNWFPCADCARAIVNAGIVTLFADENKYEARKEDPRYGFADAMQILREGDVEVIWI